MGWVGVATLIAAACYLIYRHPPATWAPQPQPESQPEKTSAKPPTTTESTRDAAEALEPDVPVEDTQSTPKASATNVPSIEIPSLHLDNETKPEVAQDDHQSRHNGPLDPLSPPSTTAPAATATIAAATAPQPKPSNGSLMPPPPLPVPQIAPPSSQPSATASTTSAKTTSMPPPPLPRLRPTANQQQPQPSLSSSLTAGRYPPRPTNPATGPAGSLRPPPSAASSLRAPPRSSPSSLAPTKLIAKPLSSSSSTKNKHILQPGYSPLDWAALTSNPNNNLRGKNLPPTLIRVTPSMLKAQNGRKGADAWTSYQGKVYNITPYLPFHPGGKGELLRGVGKDSGQLFMEIHPWVNWDAILGECLVGILVAETEAETDGSGGLNELDAMD